jgi:hypothetical protein
MGTQDGKEAMVCNRFCSLHDTLGGTTLAGAGYGYQSDALLRREPVNVLLSEAYSVQDQGLKNSMNTTLSVARIEIVAESCV